MKTYMVLAPVDYNTDRLKVLKKTAKSYFGEKDYHEYSPSEETRLLISKLMVNNTKMECISSLFMLGIEAILVSQVDSVYFAKDWDQDDLCIMLQMLAFKHGVDVRYESF